MYEGRKWHCQNPSCHAVILVTESSHLAGTGKPRCGCGGTMKREYEPPAIRKHRSEGGVLRAKTPHH